MKGGHSDLGLGILFSPNREFTKLPPLRQKRAVVVGYVGHVKGHIISQIFLIQGNLALSFGSIAKVPNPFWRSPQEKRN